MKPKIKIILFDFDEVISPTYYWYDIWLKEIKKKISSLDVWKGIKFLIKIHPKWFTDKIDEYYVHKALCKELKVKIPFKLFDKALYSTILPYENIIKIIKKLKTKGYEVNLFSDNPKIRIKKIINHKYCKGLFHTVIASSTSNTLKKRKSTFKILIKRLGVNADECVFIDDQIKNIAPAKTTGIKTILFNIRKEPIAKLINSLKKVGVKF